MGRRVGQRIFPRSKLPSITGLPVLICLMASLSPTHPCLPPLLISLPLVSASVFLIIFFFNLVSLPASFALCFSPLFSLFLRLSPLSLSLCLYFPVSLCLSPPHHSPRLPSLFLSLSTVKKAKFDGAQGKCPLFLSCPVLPVCLREMREGV